MSERIKIRTLAGVPYEELPKGQQAQVSKALLTLRTERLLHLYAQESETPYAEAVSEYQAMDEKTRASWLRSIAEHAPE